VLFAADTISYCAFEHLLGPVQRAWRGRRVILDPGEAGQLGMVKKVKINDASGGVNVMLDYDDFNSHHSSNVMSWLFDELITVVGYPSDLGSKLSNSFHNTYLRSLGTHLHCKGTLMTGHRATSFVNSVLNAAYIRYAIGEITYNNLYSMHVGDDVYMRLPSAAGADQILKSCIQLGCRLNASKQSVGRYTAEFLRMAITPTGAYGYLCRSISSCVSGNWANDVRLNAREGLMSMISSCHALINRSGNVDYSVVLAHCCHAITNFNVRHIQQLLKGTVSLGNSPNFGVSNSMEVMDLVEEGSRGKRYHIIKTGMHLGQMLTCRKK